MLPSCSGFVGSNAPDHAAISPDVPTRVRMIRTATAAMEIPIQRSLSVFEAKARIQKLDRKKSLVRTATGRMYRSCQPSRVGFVRPDESIRDLSILVSTPTVMVAMITGVEMLTCVWLSIYILMMGIRT